MFTTIDSEGKAIKLATVKNLQGEHSLAVTQLTMTPTPVAGGAVVDLRPYDNAKVQVTGLSGSDAITVSLSLDGVNWVPQTLLASDRSLVPQITANGLYDLSAGGYLKWTKTGSASTPIVTIRAGN